MKKKNFQITHKHLFTLSGIFAAVSLILAACSATSQQQGTGTHKNGSTDTTLTEPAHRSYPESAGGFHDFGDPNFSRFIKKTKNLRNSSTPSGATLNIIQLGDSHTASDTITAHLRRQFQQQFGNAGIGWLTPMNVAGQKHTLVSFKSNNWQLASSRTTKEGDFPFGGYIATPTGDNASITVTPRTASTELWQARFLIKSQGAPLTLTDARNQSITLSPKSTNNEWQQVTAQVALPFTLTANSAYDAQLGGIWLEKQEASGVTVSPVGANGIQQTNWRRWTDQWVNQLANHNADLVIISFGTNEAFNSKLDIQDMENALRAGVKMIRKASPNSTIVIVGAPDSMRRKTAANLSCSERQPWTLQAVKQAQLRVAQQEKTLYWDWQAAMGGNCAIASWNTMGLAANDLVHLSNQGYQRSAELFYGDFMKLLGRKK